jgi:hypothetical protein
MLLKSIAPITEITVPDERGSGRLIPLIPSAGEYILVGDGSKRIAFYREYSIKELQSGDFKGGDINVWTLTLQDLYEDDRPLGEIELDGNKWVAGCSQYDSYQDAALALLAAAGADRRKRSAF